VRVLRRLSTYVDSSKVDLLRRPLYFCTDFVIKLSRKACLVCPKVEGKGKTYGVNGGATTTPGISGSLTHFEAEEVPTSLREGTSI